MSANAKLQAPIGERIWQRLSPAQRLSRFAFYLLAVAAIVWSLRRIEIIPEFLYDAPQQSQLNAAKSPSNRAADATSSSKTHKSGSRAQRFCQ